jgi:hypothetical protein
MCPPNTNTTSFLLLNPGFFFWGANANTKGSARVFFWGGFYGFLFPIFFESPGDFSRGLSEPTKNERPCTKSPKFGHPLVYSVVGSQNTTRRNAIPFHRYQAHGVFRSETAVKKPFRKWNG